MLVPAVALTLTLFSTQRTADTRRRLTALPLLPATAGVAPLLGRLIATHYATGAAVYTAGISLAIWIRRYGQAAMKAGTLITLPSSTMGPSRQECGVRSIGIDDLHAHVDGSVYSRIHCSDGQ
ncbi:hypothetical protein [Streptomyces sp. NPDC051636]|uniref:hypothetical protein n=1 Tax=Streptomyces sp. NPDC051636 TaxID=3365663 RepID=UPI0037BC4700